MYADQASNKIKTQCMKIVVCVWEKIVVVNSKYIYIYYYDNII